MYSLAVATFVSLVVSVVVTGWSCRLFSAAGLVDYPDAVRKLHRTPVPRVGGVAIVVAVLAAYAVVLLFPLRAAGLLHQNFSMALRLAPAAALVFFVGLMDDLFTLRPWCKVAGELCAGACVWFAGVRIESIATYNLNEAFSFVLTVAWLLLCTNAMNLIDGIDGLAAGVALFATVTTLAVALTRGSMDLALVTAPVAGALLGFLRYNFNPASIFLGDCGSLLLGFVLGCFAISWSQKSATLIGMVAPLVALTLPVLDTGLAVLRRLLRGRPVFTADRGHIHHRLLDRGLHPRRAVLVLYLCSAAGAVTALLQTVWENRLSGVLIVLFAAAVGFGVHKLGYVEFNALGRVLSRGSIHQQLDATISLINLQQALTAASDDPSCWAAVRDTCHSFGFDDVTLSLSGVLYRDRQAAERRAHWTVRIPLSDYNEFVELNRGFQRTEPEIISELADTLRTTLGARALPRRARAASASC